jgi:hypothetical protein
MRDVVMRLVVGVVMELVLALVGAGFYMQIFPMAMFSWVIYDMVRHTKVVKIQAPINIPKDLQKQLEKHARKQLKEIERQLKNEGKVVRQDKEEK